MVLVQLVEFLTDVSFVLVQIHVLPTHVKTMEPARQMGLHSRVLVQVVTAEQLPNSWLDSTSILVLLYVLTMLTCSFPAACYS